MLSDTNNPAVTALSDPAEPTDRKPRVWPSLLASPVALALAVMAQLVVVAVISLFEIDDGTGSAGGETPLVFFAFMVATQLAFLLTAVRGAWASKVPFARRLSLARPKIGLGRLSIVVLATLSVALFATLVLVSITAELSPPLQSLSEFLAARSGLALVAAVLVVGILPGVCEELLFRGYIQTRLTRRFGPAVGIAISAVLFALMHIDPQHMLVALVLGLWCGVVVWRTGSVWSGVACHALNNTTSVLLTALLPASLMEPESCLTPAMIPVYAALVAVLAFATMILIRLGRGKGLAKQPSALAML